MDIGIYIILVIFSQGELTLSEVCVGENTKIDTWNLTPLIRAARAFSIGV